MTLINRLNLTQDEENCILFFLQDARGLSQLTHKEQWNPVIDTILQKYLKQKYSNITEAQHFQTLWSTSLIYMLVVKSSRKKYKQTTNKMHVTQHNKEILLQK